MRQSVRLSLRNFWIRLLPSSSKSFACIQRICRTSKITHRTANKKMALLSKLKLRNDSRFRAVLYRQNQRQQVHTAEACLATIKVKNLDVLIPHVHQPLDLERQLVQFPPPRNLCKIIVYYVWCHPQRAKANIWMMQILNCPVQAVWRWPLTGRWRLAQALSRRKDLRSRKDKYKWWTIPMMTEKRQQWTESKAISIGKRISRRFSNQIC